MYNEDVAVINDIDEELDIEEPKDYVIIGLNDNYTSMDFVCLVLQQICHKSKEEAEKIMLDIHQKEKGIMWIGVYDIAQTKQLQIASLAKQFSFPFKTILEEA